MKKIFFLVVIAFVVIGIIILLNNLYQKDEVIVEYSLAEIKTNLLSDAEKFEDLFELEKKIALDGIPIGNIIKLKILPNGDFGIIDGATKQLNIFDANGKYLRTIGAIGNGPGEYVHPTDFLVDDSVNFYILDLWQMRILRYDFSGNYQSKIILEKHVEHMCLSGEKLFLYSTLSMIDQPNGYCIDVEKNKKEFEFAEPSDLLKLLIKNDNITLSLNSNSIELFNSNIYLIHPYQYAIREFNEDGKLKRTIFLSSRFFSPYDSTKQFNQSIRPEDYFKSAMNGLKITKNVFITSFVNIPENKVYLDFFSLSGSKLNRNTIELPPSKFDRNTYFPAWIDSMNSFYCWSLEEAESNVTKFNPYIYKYKPLFIK
ncbi:6-bladed beta-propeller [Ignavibacterium sp.]|uniref:6-bladed beta-propeller n=1 Tax=Ignavibacterium sp. TaxID=2651167 RepID=UPI00307D0A5F